MLLAIPFLSGPTSARFNDLSDFPSFSGPIGESLAVTIRRCPGRTRSFKAVVFSGRLSLVTSDRHAAQQEELSPTGLGGVPGSTTKINIAPNGLLALNFGGQGRCR